MSNLPPTSEVLDAVKYAVAPAVGAASLVFGGISLLGWLVARRFRFNWRVLAPLAAVLALAAALAAGNYSRAPFPWLPDGKWWHWAWWAFGLALVVELIARLPGISVAAGCLLRGTAAGVIAGFVVPPTLQQDAPWWVPAFAFPVAAQWAIVDAAGRRSPGGAVSAAVAVACWGAAVVLLHAATLGFLDTATFLFAGLAAIAVIAWATGTDGSSAAAVATVPLVVLLWFGKVLRDSQVPNSSFLLVAFAPLLLGVFLLPQLGRSRFSGALKIGLVALPVALGVYRAMTAAPYQFE
jgi:hypothetical protein